MQSPPNQDQPNLPSPPKAVPNVPAFLGIFRVVGYGLLLMAISNLADIVIPPQLMNPVWELQTVGAIVESSPIPLIALALIFYGDNIQRKAWEKLLVHFFSYACLLSAILFLLLVPVTAGNALRINTEINTQAELQLNQRMTEMDLVEQQLQQAQPEEIQNFLQSQGVDLGGDTSGDSKEQLLQRVAEVRESVQRQVSLTKQNRQRATLKSAVKWGLGAVISSATFGYLWILTRWARSRKP